MYNFNIIYIIGAYIIKQYFKFCLQSKKKCILSQPHTTHNGAFSITKNLHVPGKEVIKMQDAYHYIQAALSIDHVCRKMIFMVYLSHKIDVGHVKTRQADKTKQKPSTCYNSMGGLKAAMQQLGHNQLSWQMSFSIIYLIISTCRMKIFSGTEFLEFKQMSKYDLVCRSRIFFNMNFLFLLALTYKTVWFVCQNQPFPNPHPSVIRTSSN